MANEPCREIMNISSPLHFATCKMHLIQLNQPLHQLRNSKILLNLTFVKSIGSRLVISSERLHLTLKYSVLPLTMKIDIAKNEIPGLRSTEARPQELEFQDATPFTNDTQRVPCPFLSIENSKSYTIL